MQEIKIGHRREAIQEETDAKQEVKGLKRKYIPYTFENGDTRKELLARRRHLLFKSLKSGVNHRKSEPKILFKEYPDIKRALCPAFGALQPACKRKSPRADGIAPLPRDKNKKKRISRLDRNILSYLKKRRLPTLPLCRQYHRRERA